MIESIIYFKRQTRVANIYCLSCARSSVYFVCVISYNINKNPIKYYYDDAHFTDENTEVE